jgi:hypothetical protein
VGYDEIELGEFFNNAIQPLNIKVAFLVCENFATRLPATVDYNFQKH